MLTMRLAIGLILLLQMIACSRMPLKQQDVASSHFSPGEVGTKIKKNQNIPARRGETKISKAGGEAVDPHKILKQVQYDKIRWSQEPHTDVAKLPSRIGAPSQQSVMPQESTVSKVTPPQSHYVSAENASSAEERASKDEGLAAMQRMLEVGYK